MQEQLRARFAGIDGDGNGKLSREEIEQARFWVAVRT